MNDQNQISGVYQNNCKSFESSYIGKTERSINTRVKEHLKKGTSNVYKHIKETKHHIDSSNVEILHRSNDKNYMKVPIRKI